MTVYDAIGWTTIFYITTRLAYGRLLKISKIDEERW